MAGAGYKLFNTGDVLTAAQVNTYLQEQAVMVFASAAARTTALSGVLAEGMVSYLKDTDAIEVYNGSAWVSAATGDITAVTTAANSGLAGGATSGAVALTLNTTAKGGLLVGTGSATASELTVGANNTVLTADSTTATGLKWATPSSGGMTLLSSTTLSGGTTTISSISQDYTDLWLFCNDGSISANAGFSIYFNSDTTATNYRSAKCLIDPTAINGEENNNAEVFAAGTSTGWNSSTYFWLHIPRYSVAENHYAYGQARTTLSINRTYISNLVWNSTSAITAISFANGSTRTWSSGTVRLYGVK